MASKSGNSVMHPLKQAIDNNYTGILSTINSGVNLLFWEIGTLINKSSAQHSHISNDFLSEISNSLSPIFGDYLSAQNLSLMKVFAEKCSVSTIDELSEFMNWNYIPHFLALDGNKEWRFYQKLMLADSLDPMALKEEILAKAIENKTINKENLLDRTTLRVFYRNSCQLYFGENDGEVFRKLFEPRAIDDEVIKNFLAKQSNNETLMSIYRQILEFQSETHYVINMQFSMLMWVIGGTTGRISAILNVPIAEGMNKCIQEFGKYFPSVFNKEELSYGIKLAGQSEKPSKIMEIAEIVSWPHLKVLFEVNNLAKQSFIAKQVLNNGIDVQTLKRMLVDHSFDSMNTGNLPNATLNRNSTTTETTDGNNITAITEHLIVPIVHPIHDLNRNCYKTRELLSFLTNNTY